MFVVKVALVGGGLSAAAFCFMTFAAFRQLDAGHQLAQRFRSARVDLLALAAQSLGSQRDVLDHRRYVFHVVHDHARPLARVRALRRAPAGRHGGRARACVWVYVKTPGRLDGLSPLREPCLA